MHSYNLFLYLILTAIELIGLFSLDLPVTFAEPEEEYKGRSTYHIPYASMFSS